MTVEQGQEKITHTQAAVQVLTGLAESASEMNRRALGSTHQFYMAGVRVDAVMKLAGCFAQIAEELKRTAADLQAEGERALTAPELASLGFLWQRCTRMLGTPGQYMSILRRDAEPQGSGESSGEDAEGKIVLQRLVIPVDLPLASPQADQREQALEPGSLASAIRERHQTLGSLSNMFFQLGRDIDNLLRICGG